MAYCLMGNHYHLVVHTPDGRLSELMRQLNGIYTRGFNRRHGLVGHLLQGRFKAILVDCDSYLVAVCRYVELNPVRARMVTQPQHWSWSSFRAHVGLAPAPAWLDVERLHAFMLGRSPRGTADRIRAARAYAEAVRSAPSTSLWDEGLQQQIYLGDDAFVQRMQAKAPAQLQGCADIPIAQRASPRTLQQWLQICPDRASALRAAHVHSGLRMSAIAAELGLSASRVSRLIGRAEGRGAKGTD